VSPPLVEMLSLHNMSPHIVTSTSARQRRSLDSKLSLLAPSKTYEARGDYSDALSPYKSGVLEAPSPVKPESFQRTDAGARTRKSFKNAKPAAAAPPQDEPFKPEPFKPEAALPGGTRPGRRRGSFAGQTAASALAASQLVTDPLGGQVNATSVDMEIKVKQRAAKERRGSFNERRRRSLEDMNALKAQRTRDHFTKDVREIREGEGRAMPAMMWLKYLALLPRFARLRDVGVKLVTEGRRKRAAIKIQKAWRDSSSMKAWGDLLGVLKKHSAALFNRVNEKRKRDNERLLLKVRESSAPEGKERCWSARKERRGERVRERSERTGKERRGEERRGGGACARGGGMPAAADPDDAFVERASVGEREDVVERAQNQKHRRTRTAPSMSERA
jgi:hypothetical protein